MSRTSFRVGDIVSVKCAGCGLDILLTWTDSAEGWKIYHGPCFIRKEQQ